MLPPHESEAVLQELFTRRIALLDGAMGTMIQRHALAEADYRLLLPGGEHRGFDRFDDPIPLAVEEAIEATGHYCGRSGRGQKERRGRQAEASRAAESPGQARTTGNPHATRRTRPILPCVHDVMILPRKPFPWFFD